jgi:hypothetical protein
VVGLVITYGKRLKKRAINIYSEPVEGWRKASPPPSGDVLADPLERGPYA